MTCHNHARRTAEYVFIAADRAYDIACCYQCFQNERDFTLARGYDLPRFTYLSLSARIKDWRAFFQRVKALWRQLHRQYC